MIELFEIHESLTQRCAACHRLPNQDRRLFVMTFRSKLHTVCSDCLARLAALLAELGFSQGEEDERNRSSAAE